LTALMRVGVAFPNAARCVGIPQSCYKVTHRWPAVSGGALVLAR
jgi:hypothetical protein